MVLLATHSWIVTPDRQEQPELETLPVSSDPSPALSPIRPSFHQWIRASQDAGFLEGQTLGPQTLRGQLDGALLAYQSRCAETYDSLAWTDTSLSALWHLFQHFPQAARNLRPLMPLRDGTTQTPTGPFHVRIDGQAIPQTLVDPMLLCFLTLPLAAQDHWLKSINW